MKAVVLGAKLILYLAVLVWVLGLLFAGMVVYPSFLDTIQLRGIPPGVTSGFLEAWFWITLVTLAAVTARQGYLLVGRWEKPDAED